MFSVTLFIITLLIPLNVDAADIGLSLLEHNNDNNNNQKVFDGNLKDIAIKDVKIPYYDSNMKQSLKCDMKVLCDKKDYDYSIVHLPEKSLTPYGNGMLNVRQLQATFNLLAPRLGKRPISKPVIAYKRKDKTRSSEIHNVFQDDQHKACIMVLNPLDEDSRWTIGHELGHILVAQDQTNYGKKLQKSWCAACCLGLIALSTYSWRQYCIGHTNMLRNISTVGFIGIATYAFIFISASHLVNQLHREIEFVCDELALYACITKYSQRTAWASAQAALPVGQLSFLEKMTQLLFGKTHPTDKERKTNMESIISALERGKHINKENQLDLTNFKITVCTPRLQTILSDKMNFTYYSFTRVGYSLLATGMIYTFIACLYTFFIRFNCI